MSKVQARAKNKGKILPTSLGNGELMDVSETTLQVSNGIAPPPDFIPPRQRPYAVVAVEEDDEDIIPGPPVPSSPKPTSFSKIFGNSSGRSTHTAKREQARTPDRSDNNLSSRSATKELDLSLTEHLRKGNGILASRADLNMPPQEFAAGCKWDDTIVIVYLILEETRKLTIYCFVVPFFLSYR